jgi:hypothetical protein
MSTIEDRIVSAVTDVEYGADIAEKFVDPDRLTDIPTRKGPVKSIAQLTTTMVDHIAALKLLIDGKLSFLTKADMEAFSVLGNPEAWVWNDPVKLNNGLYGYDGSAWVPSSLDFAADVYSELSAVLYTSPALAAARALDGGLIDFVADLAEEIIPAIFSEETNEILLGFDKSGRCMLNLHPDAMTPIAVLAASRSGGDGLVNFSSSSSDGCVPAIVSDETDQVLLGFDERGRAVLDLSPASVAGSISYSSQRAIDAAFREFVTDEGEQIVPAIYSEETDDILLGFDVRGRAELDLTPSSMSRIISAAEPSSSLEYVDPVSHSADLAFAIVDDSPRPQIIASCDNNGIWNFSGQKNDYGINLLNRPILYHIVQDGQSQSTGHSTKPPLTISQTRVNYPLMQVGGLTTTTEANFSSLVPLIETIGESPAAGMAQGLMEALEVLGVDVESAKFKLAFSNPGVGGTIISRYVTGGNYHSRFYSQIRWMQKAADDLDLDYQLHAFTWTLGGTDMGAGTSYGDFLSMLLQLRAERELESRRILRRPALELHSILWQNGARTWVVNQNSISQPMNLDIPNAQVAAARQDARTHLACPSYMFDFLDGVHLTNIGSKLLGHYLQRVYRTVVIEEKEWAPLWPTNITENNRVIKLDLNVPVPPLQFDTDRLTSISDQGFMVADDDGLLVITGINIVDGVGVELLINRDLGLNPRLSYAENFTESGSAHTGNQPRGLLHDSAGYTEKYIEPSLGLTIPMHNWCITFNEAIVRI